MYVYLFFCYVYGDHLDLHVLPPSFPPRRSSDLRDARDGFLGAAHGLHVVATVAVMADARDLQKSVGNGDGAWFATQDGDGRGRARDDDGQVVAVGAAEPTDGVMVETAQFVPTVYLYDNFPDRKSTRLNSSH